MGGNCRSSCFEGKAWVDRQMDTHIRSRWLMSVSSLLGSSDGRLENREHSLGEGGYSPSNPLWRDIFEVKSYFEADTENHTQISSLINCCVVMVKDIIASGLMQWSSRYMRKFICRSNKTDIWHLTLSSYFKSNSLIKYFSTLMSLWFMSIFSGKDCMEMWSLVQDVYLLISFPADLSKPYW